MKPGRLSPTSSSCQVAAPVDSSVPFFPFLFLCWSISKQIPDIMSFHLPVLQYALKNFLCLLLFSEHGAIRSPSDRPPSVGTCVDAARQAWPFKASCLPYSQERMSSS